MSEAQTFLGGRVTLFAGDCLAVLPTLDENSFDSCVTDPPYHLASIVKRWSGNGPPPVEGVYRRSTAGFMNKQWDGGDVAFRPETWATVLRVLKPGAHLIAFGGTRTYHRLACAIEDAGFEIRDAIMWHYGSGFPKSHDVSKGIDRARKDDKDWLSVGAWLRSQREARGFKQKEVATLWPSVTGGLTGCVANWELGFNCPKWDQWLQLKAFIGFGDEMDSEVWRLNGRKGEPSDDYKSAEILGEHNGVAPGLVGLRFDGDNTIRAPSDIAAQWQGWGTALKPATEILVLARKPLSEATVAANVLRWGTGAINIDRCRVGTDDSTARSRNTAFGLMHNGRQKQGGVAGETVGDLGRWPANVILEDCEEVVEAFPETSSGSRQAGEYQPQGFYANAIASRPDGMERDMPALASSSGSAARFFFSAKADSDDRAGSKHPTVKPLDLLQYLCRLITPPGGTILDCFAGTGTTGEAAWREGFSAVLIEREAEYIADIERRMGLCLSGPDERARESIKARLKGKPEDHGPLFGSNSSSCVASQPHETGAADAPHGEGHTDHAGGKSAGGIASGNAAQGAYRFQDSKVGAALGCEDAGAPDSNGGAGQRDSGVRAA